MEGKLKSIQGAWIPAQICPEQICIDPKGVRQDSQNPCRNDDLEWRDHNTGKVEVKPRN